MGEVTGDGSVKAGRVPMSSTKWHTQQSTDASSFRPRFNCTQTQLLAEYTWLYEKKTAGSSQG